MDIKHVLICLAFSLLLGCTANNSSAPDPTPPSQNLAGTYQLSSGSGNYVSQTGIISFDVATSITGTLIIGPELWNETFLVNGETYSKNGIYAINYTNAPVAGTIGTVYQNGTGAYSFSIDGYTLSLTGDPNSKWTKVSNQVTTKITIQDYSFYYEGVPIASTITLPQQLNDANWDLKENICEQAGYSLIPYAGEDIAAIKYGIIETYSNEPLYLWILEKNQTTICAYLSVREGSTLTPGIFDLDDANVK